jgi:hypothetical protein
LAWLLTGLRVKDKHGQLGIWDPLAPADDVGEEDDDVDPDQREMGKYWRLQAHWPDTSRSSISCIKFDPIDAHSVGYYILPASSSASPTYLSSHFSHGRYTQVRTTVRCARSPLPPGFRARCMRWKMHSLQAWTSHPQAMRCGSLTPRDGPRISTYERTSQNDGLISYRIKRSAV